MNRARAIAAVMCVFACAACVADARNSPSGTAVSARDLAPIDLTGHWVSIVDEDWRWRMVTPAKGDYASIPLNDEGKAFADQWDLAKDNAEGNQCRAYGAAGLMRLPTRLNITWNDENTLQIETDAGMQTRLFHFDGSKWSGGQPTWQGDSVAKWEKQSHGNGFGPRSDGLASGKGGDLYVVTTHMRSGYYRKNGVPYSEDAVLIEYFTRVEFGDLSYLILRSVVRDPKYLKEEFITSEQFLREPDNSKWHPTPCATDKPAR